ncbi:reverse transcriptase domain-containing protein [Tanacetum coccineum]
MDGINIDDLTIKQYFRLTYEDQTPSMVKKSLEEEISSEEDLDEWLKAEMEKHMSKQNEKREENALIAITNSIREEYIINNDSLTSNLSCQPSLEELNPGSFLLPFTIDNYNSYDMANIDASDNVMPRGIYEYLKLANLGETTIDMPENLREMIILGRRFLETIHAQTDVFQEEISLGVGKERIKFDVLYDDGSGKDCGMWPTCDPDSSFYSGYKEVFEKCEQGMLRQWIISGLLRSRNELEEILAMVEESERIAEITHHQLDERRSFIGELEQRLTKNVMAYKTRQELKYHQKDDMIRAMEMRLTALQLHHQAMKGFDFYKSL